MNQTYSEYEILLVDNGSTDGSVEYLKNNFPSVKIIENQENLGFAEGMNVGMRSASGAYVILLNIDARVPSDFIEALVERASGDPLIGSVGCRLIQEEGLIKYGPMFTNSGILVPMFMGQNLLMNRIEELFSMDGYCLSNCAAAVLCRKSALEFTGGFDPDFQFDWEDHDLSFRLWLAGYKNLYTTRTSLFHIGGGSLGKGLSKERYVRIIRNMLFTYFKNYEAHNLATRFLFFMFAVLPFRHTISIMAYELKRLREGSSKKEKYLSRQVYLALPQAYLQFLRGLRTVMRKRIMIQRTRKVSDSVIFSFTERKWIV